MLGYTGMKEKQGRTVYQEIKKNQFDGKKKKQEGRKREERPFTNAYKLSSIFKALNQSLNHINCNYLSLHERSQ